MSSPLQFPSQKNIQNYLEKTKIGKNPWFKDHKVLEVAAKEFANSETNLFTVRLDVALMIRNLGKGVEPVTQKMMEILLILALQNCAEGKEI